MKRIFTMLAIMLVASMANASYLYWQLDSDYSGDYTNARIVANGSTTALEVLGLSYNTETKEYEVTAVDNNLKSGAYYLIDTDDIDEGLSYYIEYSNDNGNTYQSYGGDEGVSGADLLKYADAATISASDIASASPTVWHVTSQSSAVPEPTSAILMLFGAAMLGLKRKNRSRA